MTKVFQSAFYWQLLTGKYPKIKDEADSDWRDVPGAGGEACRYQYDHSEKGEN